MKPKYEGKCWMPPPVVGKRKGYRLGCVQSPFLNVAFEAHSSSWTPKAKEHVICEKLKGSAASTGKLLV